MSGHTTTVIDPDNPKAKPREFTFDHSYWSHDGFKIRPDGYAEPTSADYTDQVSAEFVIHWLFLAYSSKSQTW